MPEDTFVLLLFFVVVVFFFWHEAAHIESAGWLDMAKVSCILRDRGVQLMLAYSWARPAILVAGKVSEGIFSVNFHSFSSFFPVPLFHFLYHIF